MSNSSISVSISIFVHLCFLGLFFSTKLVLPNNAVQSLNVKLVSSKNNKSYNIQSLKYVSNHNDADIEHKTFKEQRKFATKSKILTITSTENTNKVKVSNRKPINKVPEKKNIKNIPDNSISKEKDQILDSLTKLEKKVNKSLEKRELTDFLEKDNLEGKFSLEDKEIIVSIIEKNNHPLPISDPRIQDVYVIYKIKLNWDKSLMHAPELIDDNCNNILSNISLCNSIYTSTQQAIILSSPFYELSDDNSYISRELNVKFYAGGIAAQ